MKSETRDNVTLRPVAGEWEASASTCVCRHKSRRTALMELSEKLRRHAHVVGALRMRDGERIYKLVEAAQAWASQEAP